MTRKTTTSYFVHTLPGLQAVAWSEISARWPGVRLLGTYEVRAKNGLVLFDYGEAPRELFALRTIEDLFVTLARISQVPWGREGLSLVFEGLRSDRGMRRALRVWQAVTGARSSRDVTFRVVARLSGARQPYRRIDLARAVASALKKATKGRWRPVASGEDVEVWANLIHREFICGLRLSDATMRHREYQREHLPASLRPSVAAALAWLTVPRPSDVFLDPLCGSGTVLIERALMARHTLLLGGDLDEAALAAAKANIGPKHKPRQLFQWDAGHLPIEMGSVHRVATNLPFGKQYGNPKMLRSLYRSVLAELARVLVPRGRAVLLCASGHEMNDAAAHQPRLVTVQRHSILLLGQPATIHIMEKRR